jgi:AcrR family transcriptional regulator
MRSVRTKPRRGTAERRSNEEITAETRRALLRAGRRLFSSKGYDAVSNDAIGEAAGLTRGALHYQFGDKRGLFVAVLDELLGELTSDIATKTMENMPEGPEELERGALLLLDAFGIREVQRLLLQDAPHVLGLKEWRELHERSGLTLLLDHALSHWVEEGLLDANRSEVTRNLLFGAIMHAGVAIGSSADPAASLASFREPLRQMIRGFASPSAAVSASRALGKARASRKPVH